MGGWKKRIVRAAALLAQLLVAQAALADSEVGADSTQGSLLNPTGDDPALEPDPRGKATILPLLSRTPVGMTEAWVPGLAPMQSFAGDWSYRWSSEIGALGTVHDHRSAQFGEYSDRRDGPWLHFIGFSTEKSETARYFNFDAGELARRDEYYRATLGEYGSYRIGASFSAMPHEYANDVRSVFQGAGSGDLRLLPGLAPGASSMAQIAAALQNAPPVDLGLDRKRFSLNTEYTPDADFGYYARYTREMRDGSRPFGGSLVFPDLGLPDVVETIEPVHYNTHEVQAGMRWVSDTLQANFGYNGSYFRNDTNALTWQSPFKSFGAPVPQARFALPPNNNFHNIKLDLGGSLPWRGSFNGSLSWSRMSQNDELLAPTIRTGVAPDGTDFNLWNTPAALSQQTSNARIDTLLGEAGVSLSPSGSLTLRAKLRHYEENNKTSYTAFNPLTGQYGYIGDDGGMAFFPLSNVSASLNPVFVPFGVFATIHYRSIPFANRRDNISAEADYRLFSKTNLGLGYEREVYHRDYRERDRTCEDRVRLSLSNRAIEWATLRLTYQYANRSGSPYNSDPYQQFYIGQGQTVQSPPYTLAEMRKFDLADRRQQKFNARVNFLLRQDMDLVASVKSVDNRYGADYGRTRDRSTGLNLDWSWNYSPAVSAHVSYNYQHADSGMANINDADTGISGSASAGGIIFPLANAWGADSREITHNFGMGGRYAFSRWTLESNYWFSRSNTRISYTYAGNAALTGANAAFAGTAMPDILFRQHVLDTSLKFRVDKNFAWRLFYRYDNGRIIDWHYDQLAQVLPTAVFLGAGPQGYGTHTVGILLQFKVWR